MRLDPLIFDLHNPDEPIPVPNFGSIRKEVMVWYVDGTEVRVG